MIRTVNNAMAQRRAELRNGENDKGFTLIELMVVIIIIGILAAIAIPVFLNQRQQAWESSVKSDLANASIAIESYSVKNNGSYTGATKDNLVSDYGLKITDGNTITVSAATGTAYTITGSNTNITDKYWKSESGTVSQVSSAPPAAG